MIRCLIANSAAVSLAERSDAVALAETRYEHIGLNQDGVPSIAGTTMKVIELVTAQAAYGWSAEELHFQFPYLTLGQIHSALAYYWDHREELDRDISRRLAISEQLQRQAPMTPLRERLRQHGVK
jgi:uncharacterized protein (DUF433 family)